MTFVQRWQASVQLYRPQRSPMHFGSWLWRGNDVVNWRLKLYNTRHLPVVQHESLMIMERCFCDD